MRVFFQNQLMHMIFFRKCNGRNVLMFDICNITNVGNVRGHGARGKIREKINIKRRDIFSHNECSFVLCGKLTAPRSSASLFWLNQIFESMSAGCILIIFFI